MTVPTATNAFFNVFASGQPPLTFDWFFNGFPLTNQPNVIQIFNGPTNSSLLLYRAAQHQSGTYSVRVSNSSGSISAAATLTVLPPTPPVITFQTSSVTATAGTNAVIVVTTQGSLPMLYQWFRNGVPLGGGNGLVINNGATNSFLHFQNITTNHAGTYTLSVSNSAGMVVSAPIVLSVRPPDPPSPPRITSHPQSIAVTAGSNASFSVIATAENSPVFYQWMHNGVEINGAQGPRLDLPNVRLDQAGAYAVRVFNGLGSVISAPALLNVFPAPPSILRIVQNQEADTGADASLSAWVSGSRPLEFEWRRNGVIVTNRPGTEITVSETYVPEFGSVYLIPTLTLRSVTTNSGGAYTLRIRNSGGELTTAPISLAVFAPRRPLIVTQAQNVTATAGTNVTLSVKAAGTLPISYQWQRNGSNVFAAGSFMHELTIFNVEPAQSGTYRVIITNSVGAVTSAPVTLNVLVAPPSFMSHPQSQTVAGGNSINLYPVLSGSPPFRYQWQLNGVDLPGQINSQLYIPAAEAQHAGTYTVRVSNPAGSVTSQSATVTVNVIRPRITQQPRDLTLREGAAATFSVGVDGSHPFRFQWLFNGQDIPLARNQTFRVSNIRTNQSGSYSVRVSNSAGSTNSVRALLTILPAATNIGAVDISFLAGIEHMNVYSAAVQPDGKIVLGGFFSSPNEEFPNVVRLNPDGSVDRTFIPPRFSDWISSIALQADGKILVAGGFTFINDQPQPYVARLHANGELDTAFIASGLNCCDVRSALPLENGMVLIAGDLVWNGDPSVALLRLRSDGSLDESFAHVPTYGAAAAVQPDGKILLAGTVMQPPGLTNSVGLMRLNADGTWDAGFQPVSYVGQIQTLMLQADGAILAGGNFNRLNDVPALSIGRLHPDGRVDTNFNARLGLNSVVSTIAVQPNGKLLIGGLFRNAGGQNVTNLARLNVDGTVDTSFEAGAGPNAQVSSIQVAPDGAIWVGGFFDRIDMVDRVGFARLISEPAEPFAPRLRALPSAVVVREGAALELYLWAEAQPNGTYQWQLDGVDLPGETNALLRVGNVRPGDAGKYRGVARNALGTATSGEVVVTVTLATSLPGDVDVSFYPGSGANGPVYATAIEGDLKVLIGGSFTAVDGVPRRGIARLMPNGELDFTFDPRGGVLNSVHGGQATVRSLALQRDGRVIVLGDFLNFDGTDRAGMVRLEQNGTIDPSFSIGTGFDDISALRGLALQPDGKVLVGGSFSLVDGIPRTGLVRLHPNGRVDDSFDPNRFISWNGGIRALTVQADGKILAGGDFGVSTEESFSRLARFHQDGTLDTGFKPQVPGPVNAFVLQANGQIVAGGTISFFWGRFFWGGRGSHPWLSRFDQEGRLEMSYLPDEGNVGSIESIASQADGKIIYSGDVSLANRMSTRRLGRLNPDGTPDECFDLGSGISGLVHTVQLRQDGHLVIGGGFQSVNDISRRGIALLHGGNVPPAAPGLPADPLNQVLNAGTNLTIFVKPDCVYPPPELQWQFNGANIPGATNYQFTIPNVQVEQGGNYRLVIRNSLGVASSAPAMITINPAPIAPGAPDLSFFAGTGPAGHLITTTIDHDGRVLIAGDFNSVDGQEHWNLARLNLDGTLDAAFQPRISSGVTAIVVQADKKILIMGGFDSVNGTRRLGLARLFPDGTLDDAFDPAQVLTTGGVSCLAIQEDGRILIGGHFSRINGRETSGLVRFNSDGTLDAAFQPRFNSFPSFVNVLPGGKILVVESFNQVNPDVQRRVVLRLMPDGAVDPEFQSSLNPDGSTVYRIFPRMDGKILLSGSFTLRNENTIRQIARLQSDGTIDRGFVQPVVANPYTLNLLAVQSDGKLLFSHAESPSILGRAGSDGILDQGFFSGAGFNGHIASAQILPDGRILVAGSFRTINNVVRPNLALLHGDASSAVIFNPLRGAGAFEVSVQSVAGRVYILEYKNSLNDANWTAIPGVAGDGSTRKLSDSSATATQRFYRVRME